MKTQWYALYTQPRAEKKVNERLHPLVEECYLPLHKAPSVWSDRVKIIDKPLFSSYIFVRCHENELYPLLRISGVARIVFYCGKPAVIRPKEIAEIKLFLEKAANRKLCVGDEVEILNGSFKHVSGKIKEVKKKILSLTIEQIGITVRVDLANVAHIDRIK
jgi:transcription antitermination factor NusG